MQYNSHCEQYSTHWLSFELLQSMPDSEKSLYCEELSEQNTDLLSHAPM